MAVAQEQEAQGRKQEMAGRQSSEGGMLSKLKCGPMGKRASERGPT